MADKEKRKIECNISPVKGYCRNCRHSNQILSPMQQLNGFIKCRIDQKNKFFMDSCDKKANGPDGKIYFMYEAFDALKQNCTYFVEEKIKFVLKI